MNTPLARWSCMTQVNQALVITENRACSLARHKHPVLIPFPPAKGVSVSIVTVTMPLKIVCHCDGNLIKRESCFWHPTNCVSGASPISIFQGSALRERPVKSQTVQESTLPFYTPVPVRHTADVGVGTEDDVDAQVRSSMVNIGTGAKSETIHESGRTAMAVIPVKVRARDTDRSVITYTFLDNSSNSSFCTQSLMKQLEVNGQRVKISLSTLEKKNSAMESFLVRDLLISDLDENEWIGLPTLYTRPEIPVCSDDIPTQEDVDQWPHLQGVFLPYVHPCRGWSPDC